MQAMQQPPVQQGAQQAAPPAAAPSPPTMDLSKLIEIPDELQQEFSQARESFDTKAEATALAKINAWQLGKADEIRQAAAQTQMEQQTQAQAAKNESLARGYAILSKKYGPQQVEAHSQEIVDLMLKESPELKRMLDADPEAALVSAFEIVNSRAAAKNVPPAQVQVTDVAKLIADPAIKAAIKEAIRDEVTTEYLQSVKDGQPPAVMGGAAGGGRPPMAAPEDLQDLDASMKAWLRSGMI